jgi:putative metal-binding protein
MAHGRKLARHAERWVVVGLTTALIVLMPGTAAARGGRLLETGHDVDWRCAVGATQCHFVRVAVRYVRNGAPDPSRPILVLDGADLQMRTALLNAFGNGFVNQMQVVSPRSSTFSALPLSPAHYSAIVVASDQTCGNDAGAFFPHGVPTSATSYCDLNRPPGNTNPDATAWPPPPVGEPGDPAAGFVPDSAAIAKRDRAIKAFFDSGGGLFVASGADNGDGHSGDLYYSFLDLPGGAEGSACVSSGVDGVCLGAASGLSLTSEGRAIGFTDGSGGSADDIHCGLSGGACSSHNSFKQPRVGSQLLVAEAGPTEFETTLFEDLTAPNATITSGPARRIPVARPVPPVPVVSSRRADFAFVASEDTTTFTCQLDGAVPSPCSSPRSASGLREGVHRFSIQTIDAAHNEDPTPAELTWLVSADRDHDRWLHTNPFGDTDCNDRNARVHPKAKEIRGNRVDENCNNKVAGFTRLTLETQFHFTQAGCADCVVFDRLKAATLARHAKVSIRCRGSACHFSRRAGRARRDGGSINLLRFVDGRVFPQGTVLEIRATRGRASIGAVKRLRVFKRSNGKPDVKSSRLCLPPGARQPRRHCASIR